MRQKGPWWGTQGPWFWTLCSAGAQGVQPTTMAALHTSLCSVCRGANATQRARVKQQNLCSLYRPELAKYRATQPTKSVRGGLKTEPLNRAMQTGPVLWLLHTAPVVQSCLESWLNQRSPGVKESLEGMVLAQLAPTQHCSTHPA